MADEFRAASKKLGLSTSTIRKTIYDVKMVFAWAEQRELLRGTKLRMYRFKVAKEDRPTPIEEYRGDEFAKILSQLNPYTERAGAPTSRSGSAAPGCSATRRSAPRRRRHQARPPRVLTDLGFVGFRARSHGGRSGTRPAPSVASSRSDSHAQILIEIALEWRELNGYKGPGSSLRPRGRANATRTASRACGPRWWALRRGGVVRSIGAPAHSLRRMLAGDVTAATGDFMLGLQAIGDNDPRMAARYIRTRQDRVLDAFARMDVDRADLPAAENRSVYVERNRDGTRGGKGQGSKADVAVMRINANSDSEPVATQTSKTEPSRNAGQKEAGASGETPAEVQQLQGVTE
jgi:hypothetical protein